MENLKILYSMRRELKEKGLSTQEADAFINQTENLVISSKMKKIKEFIDKELEGLEREVYFLYSYTPNAGSNISEVKNASESNIDTANLTSASNQVPSSLNLPDKEVLPESEGASNQKADSSSNQNEEASNTKGNNKKKKKGIKTHILRVTFPDGLTIQKDKDVDTYSEVIERIGINKVVGAVEYHNILDNGVKLISDEKHPTYNQRDLGNGLWLMTNNSLNGKIKKLEELSEVLGLGLKVEKLSILQPE